MAGAFLIVDDDPLCSRSLARLLGCLGATVTAGTLAEGRACLARGPGPAGDRWAGAVVDLMLPDGLGIALALELRSQRPPVPTLLLTGHVDRTAINDAQVAGVEFALKPPSDASLIAFAARAMRDPAAGTPDDSALLVRCVTQYGLTAREAAVLAQALLGLDRDVSARALGMSEGTIKTHITAILRRTSKASMRELVGSLRGNVGDEGETPAAKPSGRGRPTRSGEPGAGGAPGGGSSGPAVDN